MPKKQCQNCDLKKQCDDSLVAWIFFVVGLVATVAIRLVTVLIDLNPLYGKIAWYVGVGGFVLFFVYKFNINRALARIIEKENLLHKTRSGQGLSAVDYGVINRILCSVKSGKERFNYFFIFAVSVLALVIAIYFDFFN